MRILYTGFTVTQCNLQKKAPPIQIGNCPSAIVNTARELGHEVEHKLSPFDEDVSRYDLIIVNAQSPLGFPSRYGTPHTLRVVADAYEKRVPLVVYWDDWQIHTNVSGFRTLDRIQSKLYRREVKDEETGKVGIVSVQEYEDKQGLYRKTPDITPRGVDRTFYFNATVAEMKQNEEKILRGVKHLIGKYDRFAVLISGFEWGDKSIITRKIGLWPNDRLTFLDFTPVVPAFQHQPQQYAKEKRWVLPALMPHEEWVKKQKLSWPVDYIGCKKYDAPRLEREEEVIEEIAKRWGSLAPMYPHDGAGWFRSRFVYSARARSIMYCGEGEARVLGDPFKQARYRWTRLNVEDMTDEKLRELAEEQAKIVLAKVWTRDQFVAGFERMIKLAQEAANG